MIISNFKDNTLYLPKYKDILVSDLICIYKRWFIKVSKVDKDFSVSYMSDIELQVRLYNTHVNKVFLRPWVTTFEFFALDVILYGRKSGNDA